MRSHHCGMPAPAIIVKRVEAPADTASDRVQVNVSRHRPGFGPPFKQDRLEPPLKQRAHPTLAPVEPHRIGRRQPLHASTEVRFRRFHNQVEVVRHQYISMQPDTEPFHRFCHLLQKVRVAPRVRKDAPAIGAPVRDVIPSVFNINP